MNPNLTAQPNDCTDVSALQSPSPCAPAEFANRLVPLCDGRPGLRAALPIEAQPDPAGQASPGVSQLPVIDFVSSSATLDRYDEIIRPEGWRLENYRRNPVFQNAHQYGDIIFTLGKALITEIRAAPSPQLFQRIEFAVDVNPMARIAYGLYKNKFLNAVSVGFIPIRWENEDGTQHTSREISDISNLESQVSNTPSPSDGRRIEAECFGVASAAGRAARRTYLEQELLEVSAVGIPANPEALQLGLKAGAVEKADLQALIEMLMENAELRMQTAETDRASGIQDPASRNELPSSAKPLIHQSPIHHSSSAVYLLQLARALRDFLRRF